MTQVRNVKSWLLLLGTLVCCSQSASAIPSIDYATQFQSDAFKLHYEFENQEASMRVKYVITQYGNDKNVIYKGEYKGPGFCNPTEATISAASLSNRKTTQGWLITVTPADYCMGANNEAQKPLANSNIYHLLTFNEREKRFLDARYTGFDLTTHLEYDAIFLKFKRYVGPANLNIYVPEQRQVMEDGRQLETVHSDDDLKDFFRENMPGDKCTFERYQLAKCLEENPGTANKKCDSQKQTHQSCLKK